MLINPKLLCRPEPVWWVAPSPPGGLPTGSSVWGRSWLLARSWGSFPSSFYTRAVCRWQRLSFLAQQLQLLCACCFSKTWAVPLGVLSPGHTCPARVFCRDCFPLRPSSSCLISSLDT